MTGLLASLQSVQAQELKFSTYLGGIDVDIATSIAVDASGSVYVAGTTLSDDFPNRNAAQGYAGGPVGADAFVAKISPEGDTLVYSTYLGGDSGEELATAIAVDAGGRAFIGGSTMSADFPVAGGLQNYRGGDLFLTDAFLVRLSPDGSEIEFATYLGGSGDETITAIWLDADGNVYVAGTTSSTDFPTTAGVVQPDRTGDDERATSDGFVARLEPAGDGYTVSFATYLGGSRDEIPNALAVDAQGRVWLAGLTTSLDFPLVDPVQPEYGGPIRNLTGDAFIASLSSDAGRLEFSTYLGGSQGEDATGMALDAAGDVFVTGWTDSGDFATTPGAYQSDRRSLRERFVVRLSASGGAVTLGSATLFGAPAGFEAGRAGLAVDRAGRVWIAGATASEAFPTVDAVQTVFGGGESDAFLARLDADASRLGHATFVGGDEGDVATAIALTGNTLCLAGATGSAVFPTQAAIQPDFDGPVTGGRNLTSSFVTCFETVNDEAVLTEIAVMPDSVELVAGDSVQFEATGIDQFDQPTVADVQWSATGGIIDSTGLYVAGDDAGVFEVTASHPPSSLSGRATVTVVSGVAVENAAGPPTEFSLEGNYPNPFNPVTTISFTMKERGRVILTLYDVIGRRQAILIDTDYSQGRHRVRFDGSGWPSGAYFYEITILPAGSRGNDAELMDPVFRSARKMVLLR